MLRYTALGISLVLIIAGAISAFMFKDEIRGSLFEPELSPADSAIIARGEQVYAENCARCHGAQLEGQPNWRARGADGLLPAPPHDATGHTWHHDDVSLLAMAKLGLSAFAKIEYETNMPSFEGVLADEDILAVLSFIKSTWPEHIQEQHDLINRRAKGN